MLHNFFCDFHRNLIYYNNLLLIIFKYERCVVWMYVFTYCSGMLLIYYKNYDSLLLICINLWNDLLYITFFFSFNPACNSPLNFINTISFALLTKDVFIFLSLRNNCIFFNCILLSVMLLLLKLKRLRYLRCWMICT